MRRRAFVRSSLFAMAAPVLARQGGPPVQYRQAPRLLQGLSAVTGDGRRVSLDGKSIADLRSALQGRLLLANSDGYDDARRILNPSFDRRPALIVQPTGPADIRTAVDFARDNGGLLLAVKCGGHSASGQSTCDDGMMIDLSRFRDVWVDPSARRARVTGGALLGQVDHETMAHGLVTTMGTVSHTGAGGLVTGGGFGRLGRRFGLSVDNLVSADVVTADGELRHASARENPDLFWGVRGGGGNFGVVTSFEFRLHPMQRRVVAGRLTFPLARARDILELFAEIGRLGPDELDFGFAFVQPPGGAPGVAAVSVCYSGRESDAERALAPIRKLGTPLADAIQAFDYVALQRSGDIDDPRAMATYLKSGFIPDVPAGLAAAVIDGFEGHPARMTQVFAQLSGGAIARVPVGDTAFAQREILGNLLASVAWKNGDESTEHVRWIKQYWTRIEPFTTGSYVNDLEADASPGAVRRNYRANHQRLVAVKNKYDPRNLFRLNANVTPTV